MPFPVPIALVPLRYGPELAGLLVVGGLPAAAMDPQLARTAVARLERLLDKASGNLAGLRILRQVRRQERVSRELEIAQQIQSGLLPLGETSVGDLHLAGECCPAAQVGGDWFGHDVDERGRLRVSLFDVAGHGIGAAVAMTMVRSALQGALVRSEHPAEAITSANPRVAADLAGSGLYATAFLARFDPESDELRYASAGHAPPLHWSSAQRRFLQHSEGGLPLGFAEAADCPPGSTQFGPGDVLVTCTDGITEARSPSGEKFGRGRLMAALFRLRRKSARSIRRGLRRALEQFTQGRTLDDDTTLVVVKRAPRRTAGPSAEPSSRD
jgi:sigma-B regulation protein RsbU (phosphoserine phosphatase)